ncbi:MAG: nitroreductase family protein [Flavobacteriales bacterium]|nr:nitroreductase family protein [Flavobacteriales bacterium]
MTPDTRTDARTIKQAHTEYDVLPSIRERFSARAFSDEPLSDNELMTLFEAAAWAPSAMNEQPWRYRYALRGTEAFDRFCNLLNTGNQPWAKNAAALVVCSVKTTLERNGQPNHSRLHDLGLANAQLLMQATSMGIFGHLMGGFDHGGAQQELGLDPAKEDLFCILALGRLTSPETLEEPFRTRELTERSRRPLSTTVTRL